MDRYLARRTTGFVLTVALVARLCYQLAWEKDLRERLLDNPWQSVGLLTLTVLAIATLVWSVARPSSWKTLLAFGLGIGVAIWGSDLLDGIDGGQVAILLATLAGLALCWVVTTWERIPRLEP